ncbi:hypothetical protein PTKIN_Ptkin10aG0019200 [Pterospermum kingtungense]
MAISEDSTPLPVSAPLPPKKENITPFGSKIEELNQSRTELLGRIQGLKQDLQNWRSKLDNQVKIYRDELTELKKTLNVEVEQLRTVSASSIKKNFILNEKDKLSKMSILEIRNSKN